MLLKITDKFSAPEAPLFLRHKVHYNNTTAYYRNKIN